MKGALASLCRFDPSTEIVDAFADIPPPIRQAFLDKVGGAAAIALSDHEPVNLGDAHGLEPEKRRLFRGAAQRERRWALWYFIGGEGVFVRAALFELTEDGTRPAVIRNVSAKYYGGDAGEKSMAMLCAGVKRFLAGEPDLPNTLADHERW